jgi:pSer/pThr/pTyr-binding forkhead associated (FHA) protein
VRGAANIRLGRDPALAAIVLSEPRVSGLHATLKVEGGTLWVKDEGSNNGTWVQDARIQPLVWVEVGASGTVRFGPVEFRVSVE